MPGSKVEERSWPQEVGILAVEIYFPSQFVDQTELEQFDGASSGKVLLFLFSPSFFIFLYFYIFL